MGTPTSNQDQTTDAKTTQAQYTIPNTTTKKTFSETGKKVFRGGKLTRLRAEASVNRILT